MASVGVQAVTGLLSEARTLIAEGGWVRGIEKRWERTGEAVGWDMDGLEVVDGHWCYCASGAVREAARRLTEAAVRSGDGIGSVVFQRGETIERALVALAEAAPNHRYRGVPPRALVVSMNDLHLDNKQQVLAWFDRAVERSVGVAGVGR